MFAVLFYVNMFKSPHVPPLTILELRRAQWKGCGRTDAFFFFPLQALGAQNEDEIRDVTIYEGLN